MTKRDVYLRKHYQITEAEFDELNKIGEGGCWICGRTPKTGSLNVDHDHKKAKESGLRQSIRGLLCGFPCNKKLIGRSRREHAHLYQRAALYLTEMSDRTQALLKTSTSASLFPTHTLPITTKRAGNSSRKSSNTRSRK